MDSVFFWDPNPILLHFFGLAITWYGLFFAGAIWWGYVWLQKELRLDLGDQDQATRITDSLLWYCLGLGLLGARLAHCFFYDPVYYRHFPGDIFKIWQGGLASHGGAIGVLVGLSLYAYKRRKAKTTLKFLNLLDRIVIPVSFAGTCIRLGNFFNQEILGSPSTAPWAVAFGHPLGGGAGIPRHPVQLYEAGFYLLLYLILLRARKHLKPFSGVLSGIFLCAVFLFRLIVEQWKEVESDWLSTSNGLTMGQLLSVPFILLGLFFLARAHFKKRRSVSDSI